MAQAATNLPVKTEDKQVAETSAATPAWRPFESLRREIRYKLSFSGIMLFS